MNEWQLAICLSIVALGYYKHMEYNNRVGTLSEMGLTRQYRNEILWFFTNCVGMSNKNIKKLSYIESAWVVVSDTFKYNTNSYNYVSLNIFTKFRNVTLYNLHSYDTAMIYKNSEKIVLENKL